MAYIGSLNLGAIYSHVHLFIHLSNGSGWKNWDYLIAMRMLQIE